MLLVSLVVLLRITTPDDLVAAADSGVSPADRAAMNATISALTKAVQTRNFSFLKSDWPPPVRTLYWKGCGGGVPGETLSVDAVVKRLQARSKNSKLAMNNTLFGPLFVTSVETTGWAGDSDHIYFDFAHVGSHWKWLGITECDENPFSEDEQANQMADQDKILKAVREGITAKNFAGLAGFMPDKKLYNWSSCGPSDAGWEELSFEDLAARLYKSSDGRNIKVYGDPEFTKEGNEGLVSTEGWKFEKGYSEPFLGFWFKLSPADHRWHWVGVCDSSNRPSANE